MPSIAEKRMLFAVRRNLKYFGQLKSYGNMNSAWFDVLALSQNEQSLSKLLMGNNGNERELKPGQCSLHTTLLI